MQNGFKQTRAAIICTAFLWLLASCSKPSDDRVTSVSADDPEMNAAIANARSSLPKFWQIYEHPEHGETDFCLKVKITDKKSVEHFWLVDIETNSQGIFGTINNDPEFVHDVKFGDRIRIPEPDISDWLYLRDGKMVGNYTVRALFKKMSPAEVEQMKKRLADP